MAKDLIHDIVKRALQNDGWTITNDPLPISIKGTKFKIDLSTEKVIIAA